MTSCQRTINFSTTETVISVKTDTKLLWHKIRKQVASSEFLNFTI